MNGLNISLILSFTYKVLTTAQPTYLHKFISVQPVALRLLSPSLKSTTLHPYYETADDNAGV